MRNTNVLSHHLQNCRSVGPHDAPFSETRIQKYLLYSEIEFMEFIYFHRPNQLIQSLKAMHDRALYHCDLPISDEHKEQLFDLKLLWEGLEEMMD